MGKFDNYNYEINKRLPEFWKDDLFLKPIERFSALLMRDSIQTFMEKMGVMQPFMVWKTLPEEYFWKAFGIFSFHPIPPLHPHFCLLGYFKTKSKSSFTS